MLFFSVALAGLVTAGSVPQATRSEDVNNISCTPLNGAQGSLMLNDISPLSSQLPLPLSLDNALLFNADEPPGKFIFEQCTSEFMNETPSNGGGVAVYYG